MEEPEAVWEHPTFTTDRGDDSELIWFLYDLTYMIFQMSSNNTHQAMEPRECALTTFSKI